MFNLLQRGVVQWLFGTQPQQRQPWAEDMLADISSDQRTALKEDATDVLDECFNIACSNNKLLLAPSQETGSWTQKQDDQLFHSWCCSLGQKRSQITALLQRALENPLVLHRILLSEDFHGAVQCVVARDRFSQQELGMPWPQSTKAWASAFSMLHLHIDATALRTETPSAAKDTSKKRKVSVAFQWIRHLKQPLQQAHLRSIFQSLQTAVRWLFQTAEQQNTSSLGTDEDLSWIYPIHVHAAESDEPDSPHNETVSDAGSITVAVTESAQHKQHESSSETGKHIHTSLQQAVENAMAHLNHYHSTLQTLVRLGSAGGKTQQQSRCIYPQIMKSSCWTQQEYP